MSQFIVWSYCIPTVRVSTVSRCRRELVESSDRFRDDDRVVIWVFASLHFLDVKVFCSYSVLFRDGILYVRLARAHQFVVVVVAAPTGPSRLFFDLWYAKGSRRHRQSQLGAPGDTAFHDQDAFLLGGNHQPDSQQHVPVFLRKHLPGSPGRFLVRVRVEGGTGGGGPVHAEQKVFGSLLDVAVPLVSHRVDDHLPDSNEMIVAGIRAEFLCRRSFRFVVA
mmetsp:Transcript_9392/g.19646  ORF Transcript_9392/g.19646 Transcript_9392/m.19646 type:complete len:221 (-) Transcript_9392:1337-1999(-)